MNATTAMQGMNWFCQNKHSTICWLIAINLGTTLWLCYAGDTELEFYLYTSVLPVYISLTVIQVKHTPGLWNLRKRNVLSSWNIEEISFLQFYPHSCLVFLFLISYFFFYFYWGFGVIELHVHICIYFWNPKRCFPKGCVRVNQSYKCKHNILDCYR